MSPIEQLGKVPFPGTQHYSTGSVAVGGALLPRAACVWLSEPASPGVERAFITPRSASPHFGPGCRGEVKLKRSARDRAFPSETATSPFDWVRCRGWRVAAAGGLRLAQRARLARCGARLHHPTVSVTPLWAWLSG